MDWGSRKHILFLVFWETYGTIKLMSPTISRFEGVDLHRRTSHTRRCALFVLYSTWATVSGHEHAHLICKHIEYVYIRLVNKICLVCLDSWSKMGPKYQWIEEKRSSNPPLPEWTNIRWEEECKKNKRKSPIPRVFSMTNNPIHVGANGLVAMTQSILFSCI